MNQSSKSFSTLAKRFWRFVRKGEPSECWLWVGSFGSTGYGQIHLCGKPIKAHRASWLIHHGELPDLNVLHSCDNSACVNPDHLFIGTQANNIDDMISKGRGSKPPLHRGEFCHLAKLTEGQVIEIRSMSGTQISIANKFGVSQALISSIKLRQIWAHI